MAVTFALAAGVGPSSASGIQIEAVNAGSQALSPPSQPWLREVGEHNATLAWSAPTDDLEIAGYRLYERVRINRFHRRWLVRLAAIAALETRVDGLAPGSVHEYAVSAFDYDGNESAKSPSLVVTALRSPVAYRAAGAEDRDAAIGERFTEGIRALGEPSPNFSLVIAPEGMKIDPQGGTLDWTPTPGSEPTVDVVVQATNRVGEHRLSFSLEVGPAGVDREPPTRVPTPDVNQTTDRGATLTWLPAIDNVAVAGYRIFAQATGRGNSLFQAADVTAPATTYELTSLAPGRQYRIWVAAYDRAGNMGPISGVRPRPLRTLPDGEPRSGAR